MSFRAGARLLADFARAAHLAILGAVRPPRPLLVLVALACGSCASRARAPFPADAFTTPRVPPPVQADPAPSAGPHAVRVHADGRIEFAGEASTLPALLHRFERDLAEGDVRTGWDAWLAALGDALQAEHPRLELLRAGLSTERHLGELRKDDPALAHTLEPQITERLVALHEALFEPPPAGESGTYNAAPLRFAAPVDPLVISSLFGPRRDPFDGKQRYHFGLDLQADTGTPVVAAAAGRVINAGWAGGHGQRVEIDHGDGVITGYSHLSAILVERGVVIPEGQLVGLVGSTGRSTGPHLHFELWRDGEAEDPLAYIEARTVRISSR